MSSAARARSLLRWSNLMKDDVKFFIYRAALKAT
jgi:hypothetical protein